MEPTKKETGNYGEQDYKKAIEFALNYPPKVIAYHYDLYKDIYKVQLLDDGIYTIKLLGSFVRNCLKWKGIKKWRPDHERIRVQDNPD
jgi:hypothetical protein